MPNLPNPTWWADSGKYKPEPKTQPSRISSVISDVLQTFIPSAATWGVARSALATTAAPAKVISDPLTSDAVIRISGTGRPAPDWTQWIIPAALGAVTLGFLFAARRSRR